jgi:hypothetical protein
MVVGGPGTGRLERRDDIRRADLEDLSNYAVCVANHAGGVVSESLPPDEDCSVEVRFSDPFTNAPYVYKKTSTRSFRLCAGFESPERLRDAYFYRGWFNPSTGCVEVTLPM